MLYIPCTKINFILNMNIKQFSIIAVSVLLAGSSAFAWSKKMENTGNLGRTYIAIKGGVEMQRYKTNSGAKYSPTGAATEAVINAPIFKPGINAFRDIDWLGVDGSVFFDYNYSGKLSGLGNLSFNDYTVGAQITPYLNFVTGWSFLKAVKPFAYGRAGYTWYNVNTDSATTNDNYFSYGFGGGVELVLLDQLSLTPAWKWFGNAKDGIPCYNTAGVELAYWFTEQFCVSLFWDHNFGTRNIYASGATSLELQHSDTFGAMFKIGFPR